MADKKNTPADTSTADSLLNLKFAQAEANLTQKTGGLGPVTNEDVSSAEEDEVTEAKGPRDGQGQRRGENNETIKGDAAGTHS